MSKAIKCEVQRFYLFIYFSFPKTSTKPKGLFKIILPGEIEPFISEDIMALIGRGVSVVEELGFFKDCTREVSRGKSFESTPDQIGKSLGIYNKVCILAAELQQRDHFALVRGFWALHWTSGRRQRGEPHTPRGCLLVSPPTAASRPTPPGPQPGSLSPGLGVRGLALHGLSASLLLLGALTGGEPMGLWVLPLKSAVSAVAPNCEYHMFGDRGHGGVGWLMCLGTRGMRGSLSEPSQAG